MRVAVLSGKGGTGKTFVAVNLASVAQNATYIDCDVEEPNGRLFLKPEHLTTNTVMRGLPAFDAEKCIGCRRCIEFCRFNALALIKDKPMVFSEVCHSCGGCALVCPSGAVTEIERPIGTVEYGESGPVRVVTGVMNLGEASGIPIIKAALCQSGAQDELTVIDCPPGSACPVMESVQNADYCILVAEPTAFGLHNFEMVCELVRLLKKPCGVVINKADDAQGGYTPLEAFCVKHRLDVLCRIPYSEQLALFGAKAELAVLQNPSIKELFDTLLSAVERGAAG